MRSGCPALGVFSTRIDDTSVAAGERFSGRTAGDGLTTLFLLLLAAQRTDILYEGLDFLFFQLVGKRRHRRTLLAALDRLDDLFVGDALLPLRIGEVRGLDSGVSLAVGAVTHRALLLEDGGSVRLVGRSQAAVEQQSGHPYPE